MPVSFLSICNIKLPRVTLLQDLPFDPTRELQSLRIFIEENIDICKWAGITVLIIQVCSTVIYKWVICHIFENQVVPQSWSSSGVLQIKDAGPAMYIFLFRDFKILCFQIFNHNLKNYDMWYLIRPLVNDIDAVTETCRVL